MRVALLGNFSVPWCSEVHFAASLEALGHSVTRIQEGETPALEVPERAAGHDLLIWTQTYSLAEQGGSLEARESMLDTLRAMGIPTVGYHLDKWIGLARAHQVAEQPFFRCLPPGARIATGSCVAMYRRWYAGELVSIAAGEHEITATPNHPVLTARGWVAIGELVHGDEVLCDARPRVAPAGDPNVENMPPTVEQVFETISQAAGALPVARERVRGVSVDFHGDGTTGQVDVVRSTNGLSLQRPLIEDGSDLALSLTRAAQVHGAQPASVVPMMDAAGDNSLLRGRPLHTSRAHDGTHDVARLPHASSDAVNRHTGPVALKNFGAHQIATRGIGVPGVFGPHGRSRLAQTLVSPAYGESERVRDLLDRSPGLIGTAKVHRINRSRYEGHVYNLQTSQGAYLADGIVTHNCDAVFTADGDHDAEFAAAGVNHFWMPPGVYHAEVGLGTPRPELACDVAFVGNWRGEYHPEDTERRALIRFLRRYGRRIRFFPQPGEPAVRGQDLNDLYASAKVVVGASCMAATSTRYTSDRPYETVGRGGFLLYPFIQCVADELIDGEHIRYYQAGDHAQLGALIEHYLDAAQDGERARIQAQGVERVREGLTYMHRMQAMLDTLAREGILRSEVAA